MAGGIVTPDVAAYLDGLAGSHEPLLAEMQAHGDRDGIPIVEPVTGVFLEVLARAAGARRVVEVGTAIGVSTLHLARAVGDEGLVVSFEIDPERHADARRYLERAGLEGRTDLRLEDAGSGLAGLRQEFDMAFLDGVKSDYPGHLELALGLLRRRGLLVVDNVLLSGDVATGRSRSHWSEQSIADMRAFNERLLVRDDLDATVLPVGDGVAVAVTR
ncbi:MAG TPA: O-methyltransferase [Gaiellales bacterium]|nr:O-methyltransferase [Gaiellales bacterium]